MSSAMSSKMNSETKYSTHKPFARYLILMYALLSHSCVQSNEIQTKNYTINSGEVSIMVRDSCEDNSSPTGDIA